MKNTLLLAICLLSFCAVHAQEAEKSILMQQGKSTDFVRSNTQPLKAVHPANTKKTRGGSRWYDIVDAIDKDQGGAGTIYNNASYNILWTDSTMLAPFSSPPNTVYDGIWIKSIAAFFDPADPRFNTAAGYPGEVAISRNDSYTLDSLFLPYVYNRNPAKAAIVDTLIVSIVKGNGGGTNNDLSIRYYGPTSQTATNHNVDTLRFLHGHLNLNNTAPDAYTFAASLPSNVVNLKIPLTAATAIDTLSNGFNYFQIPVNMSVPAANIVGVAVTFKSGDTWIPYNDTVYISGNTIPNFNYFRFVAFEETAAGFQTYFKGYWNQSSIMKNDTSGWKNWHIPSFAFTNSTYEHHWFNWKATCTPCGSTGVNETAEQLASVELYPNPASDLLNVSIRATEDLKDPSLQLISFDGRILMTEKAATIFSGNEFKITLNISGYAKGIYMLKLQSEKGVISRKVVVE